MKKSIVVILCAVSLTACEPGSKEGFGTLLGALGGAVVGSAIAGNGGHHGRRGNGGAVIIGALAGAAIGNSIGKSLDRADRRAMYNARQAALENYPTGQQSTWYNPDTGNSGTYTPEPAYQSDNGRYCREYQQTVTIGGQVQEAYGKACRQPDGSWEIANS